MIMTTAAPRVVAMNTKNDDLGRSRTPFLGQPPITRFVAIRKINPATPDTTLRNVEEVLFLVSIIGKDWIPAILARDWKMGGPPLVSTAIVKVNRPGF